MINKETLLRITGVNKFITDELISALNDTFARYNINTKARQCHFLAQVLHESGAFRYTKELASGEAYEGRKDLGNTQPGDGKKFRGRGNIQITGKSNYDLVGKAFNTDLLTYPELLEQYPLACLSAGWFWNSKNLNAKADVNDLIGITKKINGGLNGLADRQLWFNKCDNIIKL